MNSTSENKKNFISWLEKQKIKISIPVFVERFEEVSNYAQTHSVCKDFFWEIEDYKKFNFVRAKLSGDKFFKNTQKSLFGFFEKFSKLYSDFLKEEICLEEEGKGSVESIKGNNPQLKPANMPGWDIYETAILLHGYIQISQGLVDRNSEIENISKKLRQMAENKGMIITNMYRNVNGISYQMFYMDIAYTGKEFHRKPSVVFIKIVDIYKNDKDKFNKILDEANKRCISNSQNKEVQIAVRDTLRDIIVNKFHRIFKLNSSLYFEKLRGYAIENNCDLSIYSDDELISIVGSLGIDDSEGSLYIFNEGTINECISDINKIFEDGYSIVYLEKYFNDNLEWFFSRNIQSEELLKNIVSMNIKSIHFGRSGYILRGDKVPESLAISNDIINKWGDCVVHSFDELYRLLPFIPEDKIRQRLASSHEFVHSSSGVYARTDMIVITETEAYAIYDYVSDTCNKAGHALIKDIPLNDIVLENYDLSISAIYDAIYYRVLFPDFSLKRGILSRYDGNVSGAGNVDLTDLLSAYCSEKNEITFSELEDYTISLRGKSYRHITFYVAYEKMIRADINRFISDELVHFNVDEIDNIIENSLNGEFVPVKSILSFIDFPECGTQWNYFVLESYCYRFSKKFRYDKIGFNDSNAGIIAKKTCPYNYQEMLSVAVANSNVELTPQEAGRFFVEEGYMVASRFSYMDIILQAAKEIREGR